MTSLSNHEPYRCRVRYLWRGLVHALKVSTQNKKPLKNKTQASPWLRLLAPFIALLLIGPLLGLVAPSMVRALRAVVSPAFGAALMTIAAAATLTLPIYGIVRLKQVSKQWCLKGWELSVAEAVARAGAASELC